jgi:hypothetical protein
MALSQTRRPRPMRETAHRAQAEGGHSILREDYVGDEERNLFADQMSAELEDLVKAQFPRTSNLEYALLKCHLIVEYALTQFIRGSAHVLVESGAIRFTFAQKLEVAYLMGFGVNEPWAIPAVELLNKVRNQAAHRFNLNRKEVDEMLRIVSEDYHDFEMTDDRMRVRHLRGFCIFICSYLAGRLSASTWWATYVIKAERERILAPNLGDEPA